MPNVFVRVALAAISEASAVRGAEGNLSKVKETEIRSTPNQSFSLACVLRWGEVAGRPWRSISRDAHVKDNFGVG